ncbi:MAG: GTP pyrophosphokinase family protein [Peptococcaceae bacterium]|nr:GTP pyrophosphokinase family protein [Peptococcaceae bacterium]
MEINEISDAELNNIDQWVQTSMHNDAVHGDILMRMPRLSDAAANVIYDRTKQVAGALVDYRELMMMYTCAMKEIQTKFEVLNSEFNVRYSRNPINSMSTRLKRTVSIVEKLARKGQAFTPENVERYLGDVAGVRVICSYVDDIYKIADSFVQQDDITLIERKDYIANPKENGYRSLHLIVKVPVFFADQKCEMKVEVQLRTIAMDFWASLEHQLKYKKEIPRQDEIVTELKACADAITAAENHMLSIRQEIEAFEDTPTEDDILLEKLSRFDIRID